MTLSILKIVFPADRRGESLTVKNVHVERGDLISKGQILVTLSDGTKAKYGEADDRVIGFVEMKIGQAVQHDDRIAQAMPLPEYEQERKHAQEMYEHWKDRKDRPAGDLRSILMPEVKRRTPELISGKELPSYFPKALPFLGSVETPRAQPAEKPLHTPTAIDCNGSIFISYRRDDSEDVCGRIYDQLVARFGWNRIFKDVDSIPFGVDFRKHLHQSVGECSALIAVMGRNWLSDRLMSEDDFVRIEIEAALQRDIPVIPVLVRHARMPNERELPESLRPLVFRNAANVRPDPDFHNDIDRLVRSLRGTIN